MTALDWFMQGVCVGALAACAAYLLGRYHRDR